MKLRSNLLLPTIALILITGFLGCKKTPKNVRLRNRTAPALLVAGEQALKLGNWEEGRRTLRLIEENMPSSPEFPTAKLLIGDSFFFSGKASYPEATVEYQNFLSYFPRHEMRDYALYHIALCHYAAIENAERDQAETLLALEAFQKLLRDTPGSPYAVDAKSKITQCWRRLAESELMVGIFYVNSRHFSGAEKRIKDLLETYPEYADRERAYYYLGEALRRMLVGEARITQFQKDFLARNGKDDLDMLTSEEKERLRTELEAYKKTETAKYREEAKAYFRRLVESYPNGDWAGRAKDNLIEMGQENIKEELDS
jgi:outer membrane protein assembly factor BamD